MQHFLSALFMIFIIRAGIQIVADHARLYWTRHSTPGRDWFRFQKPVPEDPLWTAKQDSVSLPGQVGLPGLRHSIGLARWWHLGTDMLWLLNGAIFYFWHNGAFPTSEEYRRLFDEGFASWRLKVHGLVANPAELSLDELRALPRHEQITQHFCIQGWSGVAKWGGVSMATIMDLVRPEPEARWVVFYSLGDGPDGGLYYDAHPIEQMRNHLTMLAYEMNGEPLSYGHGAPVRLRNEVQLGFKQVKWLAGINFVAHYSEVGGGYGGYNPDHKFFGYRQSI